MSASRLFADLHREGIGGVAAAAFHEPGAVVNSLIDNPETSAVLSAAETVLDFKTYHSNPNLAVRQSKAKA